MEALKGTDLLVQQNILQVILAERQYQFSPRSLVYLVSGSWIPSVGNELRMKSIRYRLVTPIRFVPLLHQHIFQADHLYISNSLYLCSHLPFSFICREHYSTMNIISSQRWKLQTGIILNSPYPVSYVGFFLSILLPVYGKPPKAFVKGFDPSSVEYCEKYLHSSTCSPSV